MSTRSWPETDRRGIACAGCKWSTSCAFWRYVWFRWTYPRLRFDQLLNLNWKWLLPLGLLNLIATAFFMKVF